MQGHNIQAILIMERGGIPLFFMKIDPRAQDLDPMLVSGFFTAIQTFSKEVVDRSSSRFQVDYGARLFTVLSGNSTDLVAVSMGECDEEVVLTLTSLLEEFETIWIKDLTREDMDTIDVNTEFIDFREGILQNLSFRQILGSWIPFFVGTSTTSSKTKDSIVVPFIDGSRNVDEIVSESGLNRDDVTMEITRLWALGALQFRNLIGFCKPRHHKEQSWNEPILRFLLFFRECLHSLMVDERWVRFRDFSLSNSLNAH